MSGPYTREEDPFVLYDLSQPSPVRDYARRYYTQARGAVCGVVDLAGSQECVPRVLVDGVEQHAPDKQRPPTLLTTWRHALRTLPSSPIHPPRRRATWPRAAASTTCHTCTSGTWNRGTHK